MIIHKSVNGKKTSASIDDDLYKYVLRYWDNDEGLVRHKLGNLIQGAIEKGESPSQYLRRICYTWVVRPKLLKKPEEQQEMKI